MTINQFFWKMTGGLTLVCVAIAPLSVGFAIGGFAGGMCANLIMYFKYKSTW